ncbi:DUF4342 domain-containing protein [Clostridium sp. Cult3]|uniref:DUF4342 domain-containing protein n=1 Tax=Clostridium sp. Cult3 TaxID=2079004 RepID=UPI001F17EB34|nr:DUF4342 domain-containing protein [Clostridium sp. Cult3]MCF6461068.1 ubiquitin [Clostridium sp. Cult3]
MEVSLEKIDTVVARTSATFKEAKEALVEAEGDVVEAIIIIEEGRKSWTDNISNKGEQMIEKVKEILRKGNVTKITIKKNGETIMNIPVTAAALGSIISAPLTLIGLGSAIITKCIIEIEKEDGEVININNLVE